MEIIEISNIEMSEMELDDLLNLYLKYQEISNKLKVHMDNMKEIMQIKLDELKTDSYNNANGEVNKMKQVRNTFLQKKAKELLTNEQIIECTEQKELEFLKVMSTQAKETVNAMLMKDGN